MVQGHQSGTRTHYSVVTINQAKLLTITQRVLFERNYVLHFINTAAAIDPTQKQALYCKEKSSFLLEENVYGVLYALIEEADISEAFFTCLYFSASCQTTGPARPNLALAPFPAPPRSVSHECAVNRSGTNPEH